MTVTKCGIWPSPFKIALGHERLMFAERNKRRYDTTMAMYNSGRNLFLCPEDLSACTYYLNVPWKRFKFRDFQYPGYVKISDRLFGGLLRDQVLFQTLGQKADGVAIVKIGSIWRNNHWEIHRRFDIPPKCIQYVVVHLGHVKDSLLVPVQLPDSMLPTTSLYVVEKMSDLILVAV